MYRVLADALFHHRYRLNILARPGLLIRLTQNLDKSRGFVNGSPYGTSSARCFSLMPASRSFWKLGVLFVHGLLGWQDCFAMVSFEVRSFILASPLEVIHLYQALHCRCHCCRDRVLGRQQGLHCSPAQHQQSRSCASGAIHRPQHRSPGFTQL